MEMKKKLFLVICVTSRPKAKLILKTIKSMFTWAMYMNLPSMMLLAINSQNPKASYQKLMIFNIIN